MGVLARAVMNPVSPRIRTLSVEVPSSKRARSGSSSDDNDRSHSPFKSPRSPVIEVPSSLTPKQLSESNFSGSSSDDDIPTRSLIKARSEEIVRSQSNTPISSPLASPGACETAQEGPARAAPEESHHAGGRYHMPIDTTEFAEKCKGGGFHGGLVEMNHCDYSANAHWKAPACPFDVSDLLGDEAPKAAPAPAIDTTTNQKAAAGEAWESPREYANDYWKSPACPFDVSDLLGDEAPKAAPVQ